MNTQVSVTHACKHVRGIPHSRNRYNTCPTKNNRSSIDQGTAATTRKSLLQKNYIVISRNHACKVVLWCAEDMATNCERVGTRGDIRSGNSFGDTASGRVRTRKWIRTGSRFGTRENAGQARTRKGSSSKSRRDPTEEQDVETHKRRRGRWRRSDVDHKQQTRREQIASDPMREQVAQGPRGNIG